MQPERNLPRPKRSGKERAMLLAGLMGVLSGPHNVHKSELEAPVKITALEQPKSEKSVAHDVTQVTPKPHILKNKVPEHSLESTQEHSDRFTESEKNLLTSNGFTSGKPGYDTNNAEKELLNLECPGHYGIDGISLEKISDGNDYSYIIKITPVLVEFQKEISFVSLLEAVQFMQPIIESEVKALKMMEAVNDTNSNAVMHFIKTDYVPLIESKGFELDYKWKDNLEKY